MLEFGRENIVLLLIVYWIDGWDVMTPQDSEMICGKRSLVRFLHFRVTVVWHARTKLMSEIRYEAKFFYVISQF